MDEVDVAVVGGGISGLSAARALCGWGLRIRLFERETACGGMIQTDRVGGFVIDSGPDTLLAHKPAALSLVRELGLERSLVAALPKRTTYVLRNAALRTLPETSALGLPTDWRTLVTAGAFSWPGKVRMAAEAILPAASPGSDESIASFVGRRFGREAVTYVAEPVLAGIHRGEAARLSMRALFPVLAEAERTHGSVARAWRRLPRTAGGGGSMTLRDGLGEIVSRMRDQLPGGAIVTGTPVVGIERAGSFVLQLGDASAVKASAVVLATPAYATAALTAALDPELARLCGTIRYAPSINVALAYPRAAIRNPLQGWGFVVPAPERRRVRSASWVTSKWPGRAPEGQVLIRAALGSEPGASLLEQADDVLAERTHADLRTLLGIGGDPVLARVYRRPRAMPQLEVGHLERMADIDRRLAAIPGLFISASGFRGVGLPDCIGDAQAVAARAAAHVARGYGVQGMG
jgi:oxygen-dependent protoporphyrinogen oxidase